MQFLKGSYTGELEVLGKCENIKVMRCDKNYGFFRSMSDSDKENIVKMPINENLQYALDKYE